jgi:hypothetical protein
MKRVLLCCLAACSSTGSGVDIGPELQMAMPATASADTAVLLTGVRFCGVQEDCAATSMQIEFLTAEQLSVAYQSLTPTEVSFVVPAFVPVGATNIVVDANGDSSNELPFTVTPR